MLYVLNLQELSPTGDMRFEDGAPDSGASVLLCSICCSSFSLIC